LWRPFKVRSGSVLKLKKRPEGTWVYLAVNGGWKAQKWLNSFTTNLNAKAGGLDGKKLEKETIVEMNERKAITGDYGSLPWGISASELEEVYGASTVIRCTSSVENDLMSPSSKEKLASNEFAVTSQSNRMGYRLAGDALSLVEKIELISSPVDFGTVQLLPDGNIIVLMADHQTTGGYPRIASVSKADLSKFSQLMPGEKIKFKMISFREAETLVISREGKLEDIKRSCHSRITKYFHNDH